MVYSTSKSGVRLMALAYQVASIQVSFISSTSSIRNWCSSPDYRSFMGAGQALFCLTHSLITTSKQLAGKLFREHLMFSIVLQMLPLTSLSYSWFPLLICLHSLSAKINLPVMLPSLIFDSDGVWLSVRRNCKAYLCTSLAFPMPPWFLKLCMFETWSHMHCTLSPSRPNIWSLMWWVVIMCQCEEYPRLMSSVKCAATSVWKWDTPFGYSCF